MLTRRFRDAPFSDVEQPPSPAVGRQPGKRREPVFLCRREAENRVSAAAPALLKLREMLQLPLNQGTFKPAASKGNSWIQTFLLSVGGNNVNRKTCASVTHADEALLKRRHTFTHSFTSAHAAES